MAVDLDDEINSRIAAIPKGDPGPAGPAGPPGSGTTFGGRLSLVSGSAFITSDQIAKQVLYYAPCCGDSLPLAIGGAVTAKPFLTGPTDQVGLTLNLAGSSQWPAGTVHDVFAVWDGSALKFGTRQWDAAMFPTEEQVTGGTTFTGGGTWQTPDAAFDGNTNQGYASSARLYPATAGMNNFIGRDWGTPQSISRVEITASNNNMLVNSGTGAAQVKIWGGNDGTNWNMLGYFYADCSVNGNVNSFPINVSNRTAYSRSRIGIDPGGSNYSINIAEMKVFREVAPATRRLTLLSGLPVNDAAMTLRTTAGETISVDACTGTYLGTIRIDPAANGSITAHVEYGPARMYNVWNANNRRLITLRAGIITPNISAYTLTQNRWGPCQSTDFSLDVLIGRAEESANATFYRSGFLNCASSVSAYECGIGVDTTAGFSGKFAGINFDNIGPLHGFDIEARLTLPLFAGTRKLYGIERYNIGSVQAFVDQRDTVLEAQWMG